MLKPLTFETGHTWQKLYPVISRSSWQLKKLDTNSIFPMQNSPWDLLSSPLRPHQEDIAILVAFIDRLQKEQKINHYQGLLLGVTPEIAELSRVNKNLSLTAVDVSQKMIDQVWPGNTASRTAIKANWLRLPIKSNNLDIIFGDGITTLLSFPDQTGLLARELSRVLKKEGALIIRCFTRPNEPETLENVFADAIDHKIGSFDAFKLRLHIALQGKESERGIKVHQTWETFKGHLSKNPSFIEEIGWDGARMQTISAYKDNPSVYHFPTRDEIASAFSPWFELVEIKVANYELGLLCPTMIFKPTTTKP